MLRNSIITSLDKNIYFVKELVLPYLIVWFYWYFIPFFIYAKYGSKNYYKFYFVSIVSYIISFIVFIIFPTKDYMLIAGNDFSSTEALNAGNGKDMFS